MFGTIAPFLIYIILFKCPFELNLVKKDNIKSTILINESL
jgi:hypothetical protein